LKVLTAITSFVLFVGVVSFLPPTGLIAAESGEGAGREVDDAFAARLWAYMVDNQLVGEKRVRSFPFVGSRPHGSIQEVIATNAEIDGHIGRLIVKHNYGADEEITPKSVYTAIQSENYAALTIMFQREEGYDPDNNDWFWAEYNPDGSILVFEGAHLSGRAPLCLGCHTPLGGEDREILNGRAK